MHVLHVLEVLSKKKFTLATEEALKLQMADVLSTAGVPFTKEHRLDSKNRLDFFSGGVAIEVKIKGSANATYRQCVRYCGFPEVTDLLLVTNRSMGFPHFINGKPCYVLKLGEGWL